MSPETNSNGLLLDTHIWVDFIFGEKRLLRSIADHIEQQRLRRSVYISVISVWEIAMLVKKRKLNLPSGPLAWSEQALKLPGTRLLPLSPRTAVRSVELPQDLNKDPADRILVATAESENLRLVSRDRDVIRFANKFSIPCLNARENFHAE